MGEINVPRSEMDALEAVDTSLLYRLIEQCLREERASPIQPLRLESCGPYVVSRLREFQRALAEHGKAKAAKKRSETEHRVRKAGSDLEHVVKQMQDRVATEEQEGNLFYVDDQIVTPFMFTEQIAARVSYRWRKVVEDEWKYGSITFSHNFVPRPHYVAPAPRRKPSAAKQDRDRQDDLRREWEYLIAMGLHAVRDHFRRGGSGADIPQTFQAKTDSATGGLNNFSAQF